MLDADITLKQIEDNIFHLYVPSRYDLALTVCRMSEWGECPNKRFRRQNFALEDYMRWYSNSQGDGAFTYPLDWTGFNITSQEVEAVAGMGLLGGKYTHSSLEVAFLEALKDARVYCWGTPIITPFSVICTSKSCDKTVLPHELAHGRWYTNPIYKKAMRTVVRSHAAKSKPLVDWLKKSGYHPNLFEDETHAYALTGWPDSLEVTDDLLAIRKDLLATSRRLKRDGTLCRIAA